MSNETLLKYAKHIHKCMVNDFLSNFYIDKTGILTKEEVEELKLLFKEE